MDAAVDLAQALLPVEVIAVLRAVPVRGSPGNDFDELGPVDIEQARELGLEPRVTLWRDVVFYVLLRLRRGAGGVSPVARAVASIAISIAAAVRAIAAAVGSSAMSVAI